MQLFKQETKHAKNNKMLQKHIYFCKKESVKMTNDAKCKGTIRKSEKLQRYKYLDVISAIINEKRGGRTIKE